MAETQKINKLIIETGGVEYELDGGGGSGPLGPDTVGTNEIVDGSIQMEDLDDDLKNKITRVYSEQNDDPASLLD